MSNARKLAANLPREGGTGNRNLIINGNFLVWQRSLNADSGGSGYVSADRWRTTRGRIRKPNTNGNTGEDERGAIFDCVDNRVYTHFDYKLEDVDNKLHGKRATLSFEAKSLTGSDFGLYMENTGSTDKLDVDGGNQTINIPTTWTKFIFTGTINSTSTAATYGVAMPRWYLNPQGVGDSSRKIQIDNVQLELGEQATPFEYRSYDEEFTRCQRYYIRYGNASGVNAPSDYTNFAVAHGTNSAWYVPMRLPTRMRAAPTLTFSSAGDFRVTEQHSNSDACSSIQIGYGNAQNPNLSIQAGSNGDNRTRMFGWSGTRSAWLAWDAEIA